MRSLNPSSPAIQKALANTAWLMVQQVVAVLVGMLVTVWVARHLGPIRLGRLMFAVSFVSLFLPLMTLGLESITIRELVRRPHQATSILGSALGLQIVGSVVAWITATGVICIWRPGEPQTKVLIIIVALTLLPQTFNTIVFWFSSQVESRYSVVATTIACICGGGVRVSLILADAPLIAFAWAFVAESCCLAVFLIIAYCRRTKPITRWRFSQRTALELLGYSWPFILTDAAILVYLRIDQVMLRELADEAAVGIYQPAVFFTSGLFILPMAIVTSVFPAIIELRQSGNQLYQVRLQQLYDLLTWLGITLSLTVCLLARPLVNLFYGPAFQEAIPVLMVLVWSAVFVYQHFARNSWDTAENLQFYVQFITVGACAINLGLNYWLIPIHGPMGAASATLCTHCVAVVIGPVCFRKTRPASIHLLRAFLAPLRGMLALLR